MATGVFSLRKVYIKQYQNVTNNNFASWPEYSSDYGYYGGGYSVNFDSTIAAHDYSTSTVYSVSSSLSNTRDMGTTSNSNYGYFVGGTATSSSFITYAVQRFDFSSRTVSLPGKNLPPTSQATSMGSTENDSYGYFVGGQTYVFPGLFPTFSTVLRFDFSSENISLPGKNLPGGITRTKTSCKNQNYGYFAGSANSTSAIFRLDFSSETINSPGKNFLTATTKLGAVSNNSYGYFGGGYTPTLPNLSTITRLDFSSETISDPGKNLPEGLAFDADGNSSISYGFLYSRTLLCRLDYSTENITPVISNITLSPGSQSRDIGTFDGPRKIFRGSKTYGYFGGGLTPFVINTIIRLDFSNETVSFPGKNLPTLRGYLATTSSNYYGYFGGGFAPPFINTISRLDFSTENVSNPGRNLPTSRAYLAATSSSSYGYFGGGSTPTIINTITRLDFSNETIIDPGKNLPGSRERLAATSSSSYGYFGGGSTGTAINTISRLDFSNETTSDPGKNLSVAKFSLAATSSSSYGYFGGGYAPPLVFYNTITRIDFFNETVSDPGKNLPTVRSNLAATSSAFYGYFGGGFIPPYICTITRLDFSNETTSDPGKNLPTVRADSATVSNSN
jgi:hypothetical protein